MLDKYIKFTTTKDVTNIQLPVGARIKVEPTKLKQNTDEYLINVHRPYIGTVIHNYTNHILVLVEEESGKGRYTRSINKVDLITGEVRVKWI